MPKRKTRPKLSKALIELRRRLGETQESLARRLNVSLQTVALWETKRPPMGIVLLRLSSLAEKYLYMDLAQIFEEAVEDEPRQVRDDLRLEQKRWDRILFGLIDIQNEAERLSSIAPAAATRIRLIAEDLAGLALEAQEWSWRNQR
jgi:transcriptional regulator with XRE-family HTH domain